MNFDKLEVGSTFLGGDHNYNKPHLWIIIASLGNDDQVLIVNVTSNERDKSCPLKIGDHKYVTKKSYINYVEANITTWEDINKGIEKGLLQRHILASNDLIERIIVSGKNSKFINTKIRNILIDLEKIEPKC